MFSAVVVTKKATLLCVDIATFHSSAFNLVRLALGESSTAPRSDLASKSRFLLVDDRATNRRYVRNMLEKRLGGHQVDEASNGQDAIRMVKLSLASSKFDVAVSGGNNFGTVSQAQSQFQSSISPYDVILLDAHLPSMNINTVCSAIRASGYRGSLIVCSRSSSGQNMALPYGVDKIIDKPVKMADLVQIAEGKLGNIIVLRF